MRFLIDNALSPEIAVLLRLQGLDAVHVRDRGRQHASDPVVMGLAVEERRVLVSADTDFSEILAVTGAAGPSFIQFRKGAPRRAADLAESIREISVRYEAALEAGAIVTVQRDRYRVRLLPIGD